MKWSTHPDAANRCARAAAATDVLRPLGYPAPHYLACGTRDGTSYMLQSRCTGEPQPTVARECIPTLLALNALQRDSAAAPDPSFPQMLHRSVSEGFTDFCRIDTLQRHSDTSRHLLQQARSLAAAGVSTPCATSDLVHFDFHPSNILQTTAGISGVIDWDGCCVGDCAFDLVTLLFFTRDASVRNVLWAALHQRATHAFIGLCLAHLVVRQIDWTLRFHTPDVANDWQRHAAHVLQEYAQLR